MGCPEMPTGAPCEPVCARCHRDMHDDLERHRELRRDLWRLLGRPDGGGLDIELRDAVADLVDERDRLRVDVRVWETAAKAAEAVRDSHAMSIKVRDEKLRLVQLVIDGIHSGRYITVRAVADALTRALRGAR